MTVWLLQARTIVRLWSWFFITISRSGIFPKFFGRPMTGVTGRRLNFWRTFPIHVSIHLTGPLLMWMSENAPEYVDRLVRLSNRRQIEVIGGGFYEPILAMLPARDARSQVERMNAWMKDRLAGCHNTRILACGKGVADRFARETLRDGSGICPGR